MTLPAYKISIGSWYAVLAGCSAANQLHVHAAAAAVDRQDRQDGQTPCHYINLAPHTVQAVSTCLSALGNPGDFYAGHKLGFAATVSTK